MANEIVPAVPEVQFDPDQNASGDWADYADFKMSLTEFVAYHEKALAKFAKFWAQNGHPQTQEPEHWQNYLIDYCDAQEQYEVARWPVVPKRAFNYRHEF
jgi:hypothetical protein